MEFPYLSIIALSPILFAIIILLLPKERGENARMLGLAAMVLGLVLSIYVYVATYQNLPAAGTPWRDTLMFLEEHSWVPSIGINYIVGVDGLSATLVLLTSIVGLGGVLISWSVDDRPREFYAFFMLLVAGVQGVFIAVDAFLLFFFYELAVLPMYVMIVVWGWKVTREYAAMKLTLYLLIGSFVSFIAFLVLYFTPVEGGEALRTFDLRVWSEANFAFDIQRIWFMPLFLGFGVLAGLWPFHNWSPDGHVAAPTAVSMIHAGVLMKLGAYASMRVGIQLLPEGAVYWLPFVIILTLVNVVYGSFIAMRQRDMKYLIGYSSVSHMGLVSMGFAAMTLVGFTGAGIQMVSHGVMTALFFAVVGMIYDRAHTRNMDELSGMRKALPWTVVAFIIGGLVSMGMPGLSGFLAEFPIFLGVWEGRGIDLSAVFGLNPSNFYGWVAIISVLGIIITAAYILRAVQKVFFGDYEGEKWHDMRPLMAIDKFVLVAFCVILIVIGVVPAVIAPIVESGMEPVVGRLQAAQEAAQFTGGGVTNAAQDMFRIVAANLMSWLGGA
ncbi:NADH dehydrogenase I subunit M [Candidatus Promineifilum breve]|uniref:NADH dehydrogenase I subunit M n=1 Tax=Candidatus Promineifilum breve TaxID=1806508 RepID=A0A160T424_9CHLR|nr:NADH-quinone oxidoreductase subunit M [Candidatus Promineifilum breve]CUS04574.2 NADH dehydrogenase I subunit M [Candidatus Promineifilum breve]